MKVEHKERVHAPPTRGTNPVWFHAGPPRVEPAWNISRMGTRPTSTRGASVDGNQKMAEILRRKVFKCPPPTSF